MNTGWIITVAVLLVAPTFIFALLRPRLLWPLVFVGSVVTSGVVLDQVSFLDEMLVGAAVLAVPLGASLESARGAPPRNLRYEARTQARRSSSLPAGIHRRLGPDSGERRREQLLETAPRRRTLDHAHLWLFLATCAYMTVQSLRGVLVTDSFRKVRWVLFFLLMAALASAIAHARRALPRRRELAILLCASGLTYFMGYLAVGMASEWLTGGSRSDIQNVYWGGTTYAAFPLVAVIPAATYLLRDKSTRTRNLAWLTLGTIIWQAFYYDSRVSWQALLVLLVATAPAIGLRRTVVFGAGFAAALWLFLTFFWPSYYDLAVFGQMLVGPVQAAVGDPDSVDFSNFSRYAHTQIGFQVLSSDPGLLLTGTGLRASDAVVGPALVEYYWAHGFGPYSSTVEFQASTVAITSLLIETGVIGLALYLGNILMVGVAILQRERTPYRFTLLASLALTGLWMLVTNPTDILVFQFTIMPSGLLLLLSSANE